ncbi:MAG: flagellar basal body P-ring formation chaperone FlgA [Alphaproteobacteria bacterium]
MTRLARLDVGFAVILMICLLIGGPAHAVSVSRDVHLRADPVVDAEEITLGDLFDDTGDAGAVTVAMAPAPGRRLGLEAAQVAALAARHGLHWANPQGLRRIVVTRASQIVPPTRIRAALAEALSPAMDGQPLDIQIHGRLGAFHALPGAVPTIGIEILTLDPTTGRFRVRITVPAEAAGANGHNVAGQAHVMIPVPVLAQTMSVGSTIGPRDWEWLDTRADRLSRSAVIDPTQVEGMALRRTVRAGTVLRATDLERPALIDRGDLVTLSVRRPGMELTATGRALKAGTLDEVIPVRNTNSMRIVDARVTGRGTADAVVAVIRTAAR